MERAGLQLAWAECAVGVAAPKGSLCAGIVPTIDIQLRILNAGMAKGVGTTRDCLGYAVVASGSVAAVYYHRAMELEMQGSASLPEILGTAMAHEIGHLLLAEPGHSSVGVMRANWDKGDLKMLARGRLIFTNSQVERIALMARKRINRREVAPSN
jgi:hypothetical protein